jgi:dipeptidyl aminopeptidase/acylaminoacyl peptidase
MALRTGDAIADIWSFDLTAEPVAGKQQTRGTTWYGRPASSPDGSVVYYYRGDALGDNVYQLDVVSGAEEALTAQALPGGSGIRVSPDGSRLAYAHSAESGVFIESMELPSRQISVFPTEAASNLVNPLGSHGFLAFDASGAALIVLDSVGSTWRRLDVPESLVVIDAAPSPDGTEVMVIAESDHSAGSVFTVGFVSIETGDTRIVRSLEPDEPAPGLTWDRSGSTYLGRWLPDEDYPSVWRLRRSDGRLVRVAALPAFCTPGRISVGGQGTMASCAVADFRGDIWLLDVPGIGR